MLEPLLTVEDVAKILGISKLTLRKNISKAPESVPPFLKTSTGSNGRIRFRPESLREWLEKKERTVVHHRIPGEKLAQTGFRRGVGRPRKAESLSKESNR
jgi:predicted site-specific integrase-resolvase